VATAGQTCSFTITHPEIRRQRDRERDRGTFVNRVMRERKRGVERGNGGGRKEEWGNEGGF
jgi:hypothetical protein